MISSDPSIFLSTLHKSKPLQSHLRKHEKSKKERLCSSLNLPKIPKDVSRKRPCKKGSNSNTNSEVRPKTFPKTTVKPSSVSFSKIFLR
jgi:hypothetical protein